MIQELYCDSKFVLMISTYKNAKGLYLTVQKT